MRSSSARDLSRAGARAPAYAVPRHSAPVDLRLDGNEGAPPPDSLVPRDLSLAEVVRRYPDASALEARLAARMGTGASRVLVTAGADDALARAIESAAALGDEIVVPVPTFGMIERYVRRAGATPVEVDWPGGAFPLAAVIRALGPRTAAVMVVSPNNPTGAVVTSAQLRELLEAAPGVRVIVDQAYVEYGGEDLGEMALASEEAVLVRTLSKAWGLAGLRVGYAVGAAPLVREMRALGQPYPVSALSLLLAERALERDGAWVREHAARVREERARLVDLLSALGQDPEPSQGNFVLGRFRDAPWVFDGLAGLGIAVRCFQRRPSLEQALRITCPGQEEGWARLEHGLRTVIEPEALLIDLDGVLADVSASYRESIVQTAATWGVSVSAAEVREVKSAGEANNDWKVTQRLLRDRGIEAPLAQVTRRFEAFYQGTDSLPGLRRYERLIPSRDVLKGLAAKLPLAVVTGRPRDDALRFLREQGIQEWVTILVSLEDAPSKPDPAPLRLALERLGVSRAWMVGDTPDDVRAARAAGVVPVAVLAPGDAEPMPRALLEAGAARLLGGLEDLLEVLP